MQQRFPPARHGTNQVHHALESKIAAIPTGRREWQWGGPLRPVGSRLLRILDNLQP